MWIDTNATTYTHSLASLLFFFFLVYVSLSLSFFLEQYSSLIFLPLFGPDCETKGERTSCSGSNVMRYFS
jgi:hypothetical protein